MTFRAALKNRVVRVAVLAGAGLSVTAVAYQHYLNTRVESRIDQLNQKGARDEAVRVLQSMGRSAVVALVKRLRDESAHPPPPSQRDTPVIQALMSMGKPATQMIGLSLTEQVLSSRDQRNSQFVQSSIGLLSRQRGTAIDDLVRVAEHASSPVLQVEALNGLLGPYAGQRIILQLQPPEPAKDPAEQAIRPYLPRIEKVLEHSRHLDVQFTAAHLLARYGREAEKAVGERTLIELSGTGLHYWEEQSVALLGELRSTAALPVLLEQSSWGGDLRLIQYAKALVRIEPQAAVPVLRRLMRDEDHEIRCGAFALAAESRREELIPSLIDNLDDFAGQQAPAWGMNPVPALQAMTGQSIGDDPDAWRQWYRSTHPEPGPKRSAKKRPRR